jgi:hypothetical protein
MSFGAAEEKARSIDLVGMQEGLLFILALYCLVRDKYYSIPEMGRCWVESIQIFELE